MADTPYIQLKLEGETIDLPQTSDIPISITYEIEDEDDFRQKKAGTSLNITVPATLNNSDKLNTLFNPGAEDLHPNGGLDKPLNVVLIGAGHELMKGKAFVLAGRKQNGKPLNFDIDVFGDNADWVIQNKELTLHDVLGTVVHVFDKATIEASWLHDGTDETRDYVYAPFRSREPFGEPAGNDIPNEIFRPMNARPSLFLYWMLYRGFKKAGYKIDSSFFETNYFKRIVLPWTWGNFFYITDKLLKEMSFLATGPVVVTQPNPGVTGTPFSWQFKSLSGTFATTINDVARFDAGNPSEEQFFLSNVTNDIGFIGNALSYNYNPTTGECNWTYLSAWSALGVLTVGFEIRLCASIDVSFLSNANVGIDVFVNGILNQTFNNVFSKSAPTVGTGEDFGTRDTFFTIPNLNPGDVVTAQIRYSCSKSLLGFCFLKIYATGNNITLDPTPAGATPEDVRSYFKLNFIRRQLGSVIEWKKFDKFKNYKWLDLLRGTIDMFNLQLNTDTTTKTVTIEPTHNYALGASLASATNQGYYNGNVLDWSSKEDISKISEVKVYQDYERELVIKLQDDNNDGMLKLLQDRHQSNLTQSKYVFPERFKKGKKAIDNRFFSGIVHYEHPQWKNIEGIAPQLIVLVPENIANTSNPESEYTFSPKIAWYKGIVDRKVYGGWNWDGDKTKDLPFMFAVNYKIGGDSDPILTYCDQRISDGAGGSVLGFGLFKRFFWQRFAIMRHGKLYNANFVLNNTDVINWLHREYKGINGQRYLLIKIDGYKPLLNESTPCTLWKWYPVTEQDANNTYPSDASVLTGTPVANTPDMITVPLICIPLDIPD
jgi:hypothetical protein